MGINTTSILGPDELCACGSKNFWLISKSRKGSVVSCQLCFQYYFVPGHRWRAFSWREMWASIVHTLS
jgi:hypothetical protein